MASIDQMIRNIHEELIASNRGLKNIDARIKNFLDPFQRVVTAFSKASAQQVQAMSMGFKASGFKDSFDNVKNTLEGLIPSLDAIEIAATLFEGGLKEVNRDNVKSVTLLGARMKATGQDITTLSREFMPLTAELGLNLDGMDKLARSLNETTEATLMSQEAILKLAKNLPGARGFGIRGLGVEYTAATTGLKAMFPQLAGQFDTLLAEFFTNPREGLAKAAALGVGDQFRQILERPTKEGLQQFITALSQNLYRQVGHLDPVIMTDAATSLALGSKDLAESILLFKNVDLFKTLDTTAQKNAADAFGDDFKNSIQNKIDLMFNPIEKAFGALVPHIAATDGELRNLLVTFLTIRTYPKTAIPVLVGQLTGMAKRFEKTDPEVGAKLLEELSKLRSTIPTELEDMTRDFLEGPIETIKGVFEYFGADVNREVLPPDEIEKRMKPPVFEMKDPDKTTGFLGIPQYLRRSILESQKEENNPVAQALRVTNEHLEDLRNTTKQNMARPARLIVTGLNTMGDEYLGKVYA